MTLPDDSLKPWNTVAISASIHTDPDTHIELVTYGERGDSMSSLFTLLTGEGTRLRRPLMLRITSYNVCYTKLLRKP